PGGAGRAAHRRRAPLRSGGTCRHPQASSRDRPPSPSLPCLPWPRGTQLTSAGAQRCCLLHAGVRVPTERLGVALTCHLRRGADTSSVAGGLAEDEAIGLKLAFAQTSRCVIAVFKHPVDKRWGPAVPVEPLVVRTVVAAMEVAPVFDVDAAMDHPDHLQPYRRNPLNRVEPLRDVAGRSNLEELSTADEVDDPDPVSGVAATSSFDGPPRTSTTSRYRHCVGHFLAGPPGWVPALGAIQRDIDGHAGLITDSQCPDQYISEHFCVYTYRLRISTSALSKPCQRAAPPTAPR